MATEFTHNLSYKSKIKLGGFGPINFVDDDAAEDFANIMNGNVGSPGGSTRYLVNWAWCVVGKKIYDYPTHAIPAANQSDAIGVRMTFYNSGDPTIRKTIYVPCFKYVTDDITTLQAVIACGTAIASVPCLLSDDKMSNLDRYQAPGIGVKKDIFVADTLSQVHTL